MTSSVRVRLLLMALLPLVVLMPLLLFLGMTRWTSDYDKVLIANVESDLRIAEQYLARLMDQTGTDLRAVAGSAEFAAVLSGDAATQETYFAQTRAALGLDFLYLTQAGQSAAGQSDAGQSDWPVIRTALAGQPATSIDIFAASDLRALSPALAARARFDLIPTEAATPTARQTEDRGMVVHAASPIDTGGALVGGILLNRNLDFIDTINALVYLNAVTGGDRQGTATLFLEDVRVSTNVRLFDDERALGTRVSAAVRGAVLDEGRTWLDRAFVVNDWYISGYLPLVDSFGARVGMLYVGYLEAPFAAAKREAFWWMLAAFAAVLVLSAPLFLWLAKGIFAPLERMTLTMGRVEAGDLSARNGLPPRRDEIGQVAAHLDTLLDQVQERDRELNKRVEARTSELRAANQKLEETFQQLVLSEKLASIGEITAGVAHEINNPVAVIQGNVDVIRDVLGPAAAPVGTELDLIDRQVHRIDGIVGRLLQFARPSDFGGGETLDLGPVVADCLVLVDHLLAQRDIAVVTQFAPVPMVRIDAGELQQVVINLVVNAVQAMGDQGCLTLDLRPEMRAGQRGACLCVRDSGPGMEEAKIGSVFDPFFTTKPGEGTGLGLSISQTLVQRAGGLISARNWEQGAEFTVWLPDAAQDELAAE